MARSRWRSRGVVVLFSVSAALLAESSCSSEPAGQADDTSSDAGASLEASDDAEPVATARLRAVHLVSGGAALDVSSARDVVFENLVFPSGTRYTDVDVGATELVFVDRENGTVLVNQAVELGAQGAYTLIVYGDAASPGAALVADEQADMADGTFGLRFVQTGAGMDAVDLYDLTRVTERTLLYDDVAFGAVTEPKQLAADAYVLGLDQDSDGKLDFTFDLPFIDVGERVNLFAVAEGDGEERTISLVLQRGDGDTQRVLPRGRARVRFLTVVKDWKVEGDARPVAFDYFLDDGGFDREQLEPVVANLAFAEGSEFSVVNAGVYQVLASLSGESREQAKVQEQNVVLESGRSYTFVLLGNWRIEEKIPIAASLESLDIQVLDELDVAEPGAAQLRVMLANDDTRRGPMDVYDITDPEAMKLVEGHALVTMAEERESTPLPAGGRILGVDFRAKDVPESVQTLDPVQHEAQTKYGNLAFIEASFDLALPPGSAANAFLTLPGSQPSLVVQWQDGRVEQVAVNPPFWFVRFHDFFPDNPVRVRIAGSDEPLVPRLHWLERSGWFRFTSRDVHDIVVETVGGTVLKQERLTPPGKAFETKTVPVVDRRHMFVFDQEKLQDVERFVGQNQRALAFVHAAGGDDAVLPSFWPEACRSGQTCGFQFLPAAPVINVNRVPGADFEMDFGDDGTIDAVWETWIATRLPRLPTPRPDEEPRSVGGYAAEIVYSDKGSALLTSYGAGYPVEFRVQVPPLDAGVDAGAGDAGVSGP